MPRQLSALDGADPKIVVVGLGYVGLPLAVALARSHRQARIVGFDIDPTRIAELRSGVDRTLELDPQQLRDSNVLVTDQDSDCAHADFIIVTVPTPVDDKNRPDLGALHAASLRLGKWIDATRRPTVL